MGAMITRPRQDRGLFRRGRESLGRLMVSPLICCIAYTTTSVLPASYSVSVLVVRTIAGCCAGGFCRRPPASPFRGLAVLPLVLLLEEHRQSRRPLRNLIVLNTTQHCRTDVRTSRECWFS